jgi:hypothetical protein
MSRAMIMYYYIKILEQRGWVVWPLRALLFTTSYAAILLSFTAYKITGGANDFVIGAMVGAFVTGCSAMFYPMGLMITESITGAIGGYFAGVKEEARRLEAHRVALLEAEEAHGGALTIVGRDQDDEGGGR